MSDQVLISICIPAYKNTSYLTRLLDSISIQNFADFEVVITDDSPDESVNNFIAGYPKLKGLRYFRNPVPLGTPENWNESIRRANGKWIKLMHDDDWFSDRSSLQTYADAIHANGSYFIFSAYNNIFLNSGKQRKITPLNYRLRAMEEEPYTLLSRNVIGPPSVTMIRNDRLVDYDRNTKWVVDIDYYIRRLLIHKYFFINKALINVGMSYQQVTADCVYNRKVQMPENFYLLNKVGYKKLKNIMVYDAWWRMMRNLEITNEAHIRDAGYDGQIPSVIASMISVQRHVPRSLLTIGVFSKICMFVHYLFHRNSIIR